MAILMCLIEQTVREIGDRTSSTQQREGYFHQPSLRLTRPHSCLGRPTLSREHHTDFLEEILEALSKVLPQWYYIMQYTHYPQN